MPPNGEPCTTHKQTVDGLCTKIHDLIYEQAGKINVAEVLGILELVKIQILRNELE